MPGVLPPFLLLLLLVPAGGTAQTFPRDLVPRSTVGLAATATYPCFGGLRGDNLTAQLGLGLQSLRRLGDSLLLLAARDHIYAFELAQDPGTLYPTRHLTWQARDRENCAMRGGRQDECHNYIRVLVPRDAGTVLACGTNAFSPLCRTYQVSSLAQEGEELSGQARCPFDAKQSIVALYVDGSLYSATAADFQASDFVIYRSPSPGRPPLRTLKYSSRWLQEPHFVQALPYGAFVYFFFREVALELSAQGKVLVARVARVCRNDRGGSPRVLERRWTSFLKLRLQCSVPGDANFHFDVLEAVTPPSSLHGHPAVLALFGTQPNSIPGSAVCAFYLADVERAFEGPFAEPRGATWAPVPEDRVPRPRPGSCAGQGSAAGIGTSGDFPDETLSFAKEHPLLHGTVPPAGGQPLFTRTGPRLTQLAADVGAGPQGNRTVLFLGTEDGRLLKVLLGTWHPGTPQRPPPGTPAPTASPRPGAKADASSESLLLEEISLYEPGRCQGQQGASRVLGLELHLPGQELLVAFAGCLLRVPLSRCARHSSCRRSCLAARDPYCVWLPAGGCVPFTQDLPSGIEQDLEGASGSSGSCQGVAAAGDSDRDLAHGVRQPGPGVAAAAAVPVPVLVGCVLGAFASGALAAGLLAACCRRPAAPRPPPETPAPAAAAQRPPPAPRLYPLLPPPAPAEPPSPEPPRERLPEPRRGRAAAAAAAAAAPPACPQPPGPGPPPEGRLQGGGRAGGCGWAATPAGAGSFANRVRPGAALRSLPPAAPRDAAPRDAAPRDAAPRDTAPRDASPRDTAPRDTSPRDAAPRDTSPRRLDVPPDSPPPPPRRALAQRHSLGGAPGTTPGPPRGLSRMHSLGTPGAAPWGPPWGTPWGPRPPAPERSFSAKPPLLPKPLLVPAAPGRP